MLLLYLFVCFFHSMQSQCFLFVFLFFPVCVFCIFLYFLPFFRFFFCMQCNTLNTKDKKKHTKLCIFVRLLIMTLDDNVFVFVCVLACLRTHKENTPTQTTVLLSLPMCSMCDKSLSRQHMAVII